MKYLGIRARVFLTTMVASACLLLLTHWVMHRLVNRILEDELAAGLSRARQAQISFSDVRNQVLIDQARAVAQVPHLRAVLGTPDVDESTVRFTIAGLAQTLEEAFLFVTDADGQVLADSRGLGLPLETDRLEIELGLAGEESCAVWEGAGEALLLALCPVTLDGAVLGLVGVGYPLGDHARDLRRVTGLDITILRGERVLASSWTPSLDPGDPSAKPSEQEALPWVRIGAGQRAHLSVGGREYLTTTVPMGSDGQVVLSRPLDELERHYERAKLELLLAGLALAVLGLLVSERVSQRIARPIRELTAAARAFARGGLETQVAVHGQDEVGQLGSAFNDMARQLSALMVEAVQKAHAAEQASAAKSVFLATISHEVRTPLHGVLGFVEQVLGTELDAEQREQLLLVQGSGQELLGIIESVLDFASLEAGGLQLEQVEFHLGACLQRSLDAFRPAAAAKQLELRLDLAPGLPEVLVGPANRLRQIVGNLIGNAVKFTSSGSVLVRATCQEQGERDLRLRVEVEDTGIGIAADRLGHLFQPFVQLDSGSDREFGGTGLGLAICKELAAGMDGEVGLWSEPGLGSTFWFTVRLDLAPAEGARDRAARRQPSPSEPGTDPRRAAADLRGDPATRERRARQRILVAEDNRVNQRMIAVVLDRAGWPHELAENGQQAVELAASGNFDLVLMDCQMPVMDGLAATRRIRAGEAGSDRHLPIVALTANAFESDRRNCLAAGMDDFVAKPFEAVRLAAVLDGCLARAAVPHSGSSSSPAR